MASPPLPPPLMYSAFRKILVLSVLLLLFVSVCHSLCSESQFQSRRRMLEAETHEDPPLKKKSSSTQTQNQNQKQSLKNQTKLIKPKISMKNQTKTTIQSQSNNLSSKNQTKKASQSSNYLSTKNQTKLVKVTDTGLKKMNSTSKIKKQLNSTSKPLNSTKTAPISSKKSVDLPPKASGSKNKTTTTTTTKSTATTTTKETKTKPTDKNQKPKKPIKASWIDSDDDDDDFVSELKDLPSKFQQTLIPDLERISTTSKAYITKANKQITKGFKPYVGNKYAPTIATILSCAFALIPLILVSLIFNRIKAYFSLQKILIFVQIYLSIYFSILCLSSLVTGLEPLKFFYATSQATYVCLQVSGPGPNDAGLRRRAALLRDGVSQGCVAAAAQDELEGPRDLCHVFPPDLCVSWGR
ncbi:putative serine/threonine-protein kinase dyrk2 [Senna tora]|uniref:Putative serine/threonine-protein kinase dyrk2 n=1 Tax=Senna tora TaxID=362788 RepID=A0A834WXV6_9FABA|nr:putative serine/threonine-protein kinase dyrk2 [Senna tora]